MFTEFHSQYALAKAPSVGSEEGGEKSKVAYCVKAIGYSLMLLRSQYYSPAYKDVFS